MCQYIVDAVELGSNFYCQISQGRVVTIRNGIIRNGISNGYILNVIKENTNTCKKSDEVNCDENSSGLFCRHSV